MSFAYTRARRDNVDCMISLAGPSGSGKTYSGMILAEALSGDLPFAMGDTEGKRGLHYADDFNFERFPLTPPYHPDKYAAFIKTVCDRGFPCALIDSGSHEWAGEGGILEMADRDGSKPPSNWIKPKAAHKRMMNAFISAGIHIIFCLRADEKIEIVDDPRRPGKKLINSLGFQPICEKSFMFEMTISLTLSPFAPGVVDLTMPHKLQDRFKPLFMPGTHISRAAGEGLAQWARGGELANPDQELWMRARKAANEGTDALRDFVETKITAEERSRLKPIGTELNNTAKKANEILASGLQRPTEPEPEPEQEAAEHARPDEDEIAAEADRRAAAEDTAPERLV